MQLEFILVILIAYLSGSLPWSVWLGKRFSGIDPRTQTDGNPGAANAFRTAGKSVGALVLILDFLKAFVPVATARWVINIPDTPLLLIAIAPMFGHAFSVFLRFRGGRGITSLFGVWTGLTFYEVPIILGLATIVLTFLIKNDELKTLLIPIVTCVFLILMDKPSWMIVLAIIQFLILLAKIIPFYMESSKQLTYDNSHLDGKL
jgi:acyl phosphate:glycerol-3-phosphate acyltransferase